MVLTTLFAALSLVQNPIEVTTLAPVQGSKVFFGQSSDKKISTNFNNASLKDVLNFLRKQKVDFAVDPDQFKDRRLSLSLIDVPVSAALSAIASALDAHWEMTGGVRVLKKGAGSSFGFQTMPGMKLDGRTIFTPQSFDMKGFDMKGFDGKVFKLDGKAFDFKTFDKNQSEEMKKAMEEMRKAMGDQKFQFQGLDKAQTEQMQKAMEEARKAMAGQKFDFKGFDKNQSEEMKKAMEEVRKAMANQKFDFKTLDGKDWQKGAFILKTQNVTELTKSITPAQKELQKKQGYLKVSDLTPDQRKMLGISDDKGKIEITITRDGETLKIKGE